MNDCINVCIYTEHFESQDTKHFIMQRIACLPHHQCVATKIGQSLGRVFYVLLFFIHTFPLDMNTPNSSVIAKQVHSCDSPCWFPTPLSPPCSHSEINIKHTSTAEIKDSHTQTSIIATTQQSGSRAPHADPAQWISLCSFFSFQQGTWIIYSLNIAQGVVCCMKSTTQQGLFSLCAGSCLMDLQCYKSIFTVWGQLGLGG